MAEMCGWIDDVDDGWVYGKYAPDGTTGFAMHILDVPECQRVDLQPGMYFQFVNGHLLLEKTMWTTHEIEQADVEAKRIHTELFGNAP